MLLVARLGKRPLFLVVLLCAVVASATYFSLGAGSYRTVAAPGLGSVSLPPSGSAAETNIVMPPLSEFAAIVSRPLFSPTRRPAETADASGGPAVKTVSPIAVTIAGVIISDDERIVIVRRDKTNTYLRLVEGDDIDGWRVQAIAPDRLVLQRGSVTEELELAQKPPSGAPLAGRRLQSPQRQESNGAQ